MLSVEEQMLAQRLSGICHVPVKFAELVIASLTIDNVSIEAKLKIYQDNIEFLDKVVKGIPNRTNDESEFLAQCLAHSNDAPIQLCRMVIQSGSDESIAEEDVLTIRNERLNFLYKVFAFVQNHPNFINLFH